MASDTHSDDLDDKLNQINETINEIHRKLRKIGKKVSAYDKGESKKVLLGLDQESLDKLHNCLKGIGESVPKLTSDDPHTFVSGCMDLAAAVTALVPVYGPLISGLLAVVSGVIVASAEKTDMVAVYKEIIEKVLSKYRDEDIKAEAAGTKSELITIQGFLNAFLMKGAHTKDDVTSLTGLQIPTVGTKFLGKLEYYINLYSKNKESEDDDAVEFQARCAVDYIEIYLRLSALRQLLLLQYYCSLQSETVKKDFEATAEGVIGTLDMALKNDKDFVKELPLVFTIPGKAVLASVFNLSEHPTIEALLGKAVADIDMGEAVVQLKPKQSPTHYLSNKISEISTTRIARNKPTRHGVQKSYSVIGSDRKNATVTSCFTFNKDGHDNIFQIKGDQMNSIGVTDDRNFFAGGKDVMDDGQNEDLCLKGNNSRWKLIRLFQMDKDQSRQLYLIASVKFPARFLYLADGGMFTDSQAMVKVGDPGARGYWYLDRLGAEIARSRPRPESGNWFFSR